MLLALRWCRDNSKGQLGRLDIGERGSQPGQMGARLPALDLGPGLQAAAVAAGEEHTCALLQPGGLVKCWGCVGPGSMGGSGRVGPCCRAAWNPVAPVAARVRNAFREVPSVSTLKCPLQDRPARHVTRRLAVPHYRYPICCAGQTETGSLEQGTRSAVACMAPVTATSLQLIWARAPRQRPWRLATSSAARCSAKVARSSAGGEAGPLKGAVCGWVFKRLFIYECVMERQRQETSPPFIGYTHVGQWADGSSTLLVMPLAGTTVTASWAREIRPTAAMGQGRWAQT